MTPSSTTSAMGFQQTTGRAFSTAARLIAVTFSETGITAASAGTSASFHSVAVMESVPMLLTIPTTVASVLGSARLGLNVSMDTVGMLKL